MTWWSVLLISYGVCVVSFALAVTFMYGFAPEHSIMRWLGDHPWRAETPGWPSASDYFFNVAILALFWWWAVPLYYVIRRVVVALAYVIASPIILPYKLGRRLRARRARQHARWPRAKVIP